MEIKEAIAVLSYEKKYADKDCSCHISLPCDKCVNKPDEEAVGEATLTAISHLETLQKVKEAGGVKKEKIPEIKQNFQSLFPEEIGLLLHQRSKIIGYNEALVLKDAELAGKLEGLEGELGNIEIPLDTNPMYVEETKNPAVIKLKSRYAYIIAEAIQELILGKKERKR